MPRFADLKDNFAPQGGDPIPASLLNAYSYILKQGLGPIHPIKIDRDDSLNITIQLSGMSLFLVKLTSLDTSPDLWTAEIYPDGINHTSKTAKVKVLNQSTAIQPNLYGIAWLPSPTDDYQALITTPPTGSASLTATGDLQISTTGVIHSIDPTTSAYTALADDEPFSSDYYMPASGRHTDLATPPTITQPSYTGIGDQLITTQRKKRNTWFNSFARFVGLLSTADDGDLTYTIPIQPGTQNPFDPAVIGIANPLSPNIVGYMRYYDDPDNAGKKALDIVIYRHPSITATPEGNAGLQVGSPQGGYVAQDNPTRQSRQTGTIGPNYFNQQVTLKFNNITTIPNKFELFAGYYAGHPYATGDTFGVVYYYWQAPGLTPADASTTAAALYPYPDEFFQTRQNLARVALWQADDLKMSHPLYPTDISLVNLPNINDLFVRWMGSNTIRLPKGNMLTGASWQLYFKVGDSFTQITTNPADGNALPFCRSPFGLGYPAYNNINMLGRAIQHCFEMHHKPHSGLTQNITVVTSLTPPETKTLHFYNGLLQTIT
jgi:hypothetical protein